DHDDGAVAVHHDQIARFCTDRLKVDEADGAIVLGFDARLFADSRCRTTDVERTHRELRARFADGLSGDDADSFTEFDQAARSQVASVTENADATLRFAGEHGTDLDALDTGSLDGARKLFRDLLVDVDDDVALVVLDLLKRHAANDAIAQRFDDVAGFNDGADVDSVHGGAIVFADDDVLRNIDETTREISGIRGLQGRIGQSLTGTVRRDE